MAGVGGHLIPIEALHGTLTSGGRYGLDQKVWVRWAQFGAEKYGEKKHEKKQRLKKEPEGTSLDGVFFLHLCPKKIIPNFGQKWNVTDLAQTEEQKDLV